MNPLAYSRITRSRRFFIIESAIIGFVGNPVRLADRLSAFVMLVAYTIYNLR